MANELLLFKNNSPCMETYNVFQKLNSSTDLLGKTTTRLLVVRNSPTAGERGPIAKMSTDKHGFKFPFCWQAH